MEIEGSWGDDTVMGVDEVLDDPGVHGNISITFPGYSHMNYLRVGFFFLIFVFARGVWGVGGGRRCLVGRKWFFFFLLSLALYLTKEAVEGGIVKQAGFGFGNNLPLLCTPFSLL